MRKIKAILFDMDGVLIDAKDWHYEALNKALGLFGITINRYEHLTTFDGLPTRVKLEILSKRFFLPKALHHFINQLKQSYTNEIIYEKCHPIFHHEYALSNLQRMGYKIAVCSNSIKKTIELMMNRAELSSYVDLILSNEDVKKAKPDPEIYITAIKKLGLKPDECIVIEDNIKGIEAGKASGAAVLEVTDIYDVTLDNILNFIRGFEND